jgi:hypothetical protein
MSKPLLPERLRRAIAADDRRVRPAPPPAIRALEVVLLGAVLAVVALAVYRLRANASALGGALLWGPTAVQALAGAVLVGLAVREAIPGWSLSRGRVLLALALGFLVQLGAALAVFVHGPLMPARVLAGVPGISCASREAMLSLPVLAAALFFVVRLLPVRPRRSGALAGLGAGLVADGIWHLVCPVSNLSHVLVWHIGVTGLVTAAGWLLGVAWESRERRRRSR